MINFVKLLELFRKTHPDGPASHRLTVDPDSGRPRISLLLKREEGRDQWQDVFLEREDLEKSAEQLHDEIVTVIEEQ